MNIFKKLFTSDNSNNVNDNPLCNETDTSDNTEDINNTENEASEPDAENKEKEERDTEFETLRDDGLRAMRMNEFQYAERLFKGALTRKDDEATKSYLAEVYLRVGDGVHALPLLEELAELHPDNEELLVTTARAAEMAGEWDKARDAARLALDINENNPNAKFSIAKADYQQKNYLHAVAMLTELTSKNFDAAPILQLRAQTLFDMQQYPAAEEDIDNLLEREEVSEEAYLLKGDIRHALGDNAGAAGYYAKMRDNDPFNKESVLRENAVYLEDKNLEKAIRLLDEAIDLQPEFAEAYFQRGNVRRMLHDEAGAADDLKRALELNEAIATQFSGEYSNIENQMNAQARFRNPFGF